MPGAGSQSRIGKTLRILGALSQTFIALFTAPFRGSSGCKNYMRHVLFTGVRAMLRGGYIAPTTSTNEQYAKFVKLNGLEARTVDLNEGTKGHWLGDQDAKKMILFFHGGAYVQPAGPPHFKFCWSLIKEAKEKRKSLKVMLLSYELSPHVHYPHHLMSAVHMINHLVGVEGMSPSDIILFGDSSGGNMVLGVLSHAMHPHPSITPLHSTRAFATAIMHSPKVCSSPVRTADSFTRNQYKDFVPREGQKYANADYLGPGGKPDAWNSWLKADKTIDENWWADLKYVVKSILITGGGDEIVLDDIVEVAEDIKAAHHGATLFVGPNEPHDAAIMMEFGFGGKAESGAVLKEWVLKSL